MPKIKQSPKLPAEKRREQILKAAEKVIIKRGYRHTTMDQVARQARLTKGALYFHFKNKEDIFFELVKRVTTRNLERHETVPQGKATPADFLKVVFEGKDKCGVDIGDLGSNLDFWVQAINVPRIRSYLNSLDTVFFELFERSLDPRYLAERKMVRQMAVMTLAMIDGLMVRGILNPPTVDYHKQISLLNGLFDCWIEKRNGTSNRKH